MGEVTLKEIFEKARNESRSSAEYWNKVETCLTEQKKDSISTEEILKLIFGELMQDRQLISNAFQQYFTAYLVATSKLQEVLSKQLNYFSLLPTVFLMHHTTELFLKMAKIDIYNTVCLGRDSKELIKYLSPTNVKELKNSNHSVKYLFDDEKIKLWFSVLENGEEYLKAIKENYINLSEALSMENLAEEARFPLKIDSYVYNDRSKIEKEKIKLCSNLIDNLIKILNASYLEWHTEGKNHILQQCINNTNKKEGTPK